MVVLALVTAGLAAETDEKAASAQKPSGMALPATVHELPNGLVVLLLEDHRTDTVALHLAFGVGSRDEKPGELGCAHLFEHLMFEGSKSVPVDKFDEWLTAAGGNNNAWTSDDRTAYHMTFPSGALDLALFLESDRLGFLDAGLSTENLENQQKVVLQERAEGYAEPNGRDDDALTRLLFPDNHPYHHPVIGTVADIEGFALEGVKDFWQRHYRTRNAVLALVGNFDTASAITQVEHWFSDVPDNGPATERPLEHVPGNKPASAGMLEDKVEERTVYLAWETVHERHPDAAAFEVLDYILVGGRGTRIDEALYYSSKLASDVGSYSYIGDISGRFVIYASSPKTPLAKLVTKIDKQLGGIVTSPPTSAEIDRAKRALRGGVLNSLELPEGKASWLTDCYHWTGAPDCLDTEWKKIDAVTSADLVRIAKKYLLDRPPTTLSVVPAGQSATTLPGAKPVELP